MKSRTVFVFSTTCVLAAVLVAWKGGLFAAERKPAAEPTPIEDPRPDEKSEAVVVAIVDTGVDTGHAGLKDRCLPGINVAEPGEPVTDLVGHGTAVALLVRNTYDDRAWSAVTGRPIKFLPVKVTAGADAQTLPALLGLGVKKAVDAGADIICVPMGASRSTAGLDEAVEAAEKKGILVIAAAGIADGSTDFWPAAHAWAVSCTAWEPSLVLQPNGEQEMVEGPAQLAQVSGKTELLGEGFAKFDGGGGEIVLQGTSAVCARATGHAAAILSSRRDLGGVEARMLLTLGGPALRIANFGGTYPMRRMDPKAYAAALRSEAAADFVVIDELPDPAPLIPGKPGKSQITIRNIGRKAGAGQVEIEFPKTKVLLKASFASVEPGETCKVTLDLPALDEGTHASIVRVTAETDPNPENSWMQIDYRPKANLSEPAVIGKACVHRYRADQDTVALRVELINTTSEAIKARLIAETGNKSGEREVTIAPRSNQFEVVEVALPEKTEGYKRLRIEVGIKRGEEVLSQASLKLRLDSLTATPQYADAWATKEIIFDAPAFVVEERADFPVLLFAPEVHTLLSEEEVPNRPSKLKEPRAARGLWLHEVYLEEIPQDVALATDLLPWGFPKPGYGGKVIMHVRGASDRYARHPELTKLCDPPPFLENGEGGLIPDGPDTVIQWINDDGWHVVINIPVRALASVAVPEAYLYCRAQVQDEAMDPASAHFKGFKDRNVVHQTVLRIRLHASLPVLHPHGQYYDIHVHTASEFSREIVEPRLAFGGPLWMLLRSAYAMGFVDWNYLAAKKGLPGAEPPGEKLVTTDHNCFLRDDDIPSWFPYQTDKGAPEEKTIRRFVGNGANQELALAAPGRDIGAQHALVYGHDPLKGPWHGGRSWRSKVMEYKLYLDVIKQFGVEKRIAKTLRDIMRGLLENDSLRQDLVAKVAKENPKLRETFTDDRARMLCQIWTEMKDEDLEAIPGQIQRIVDAASTAMEENTWNVASLEPLLVNVQGRYIAAHPFTGHGLHWNLEDLDRAANLAAGSASPLASADEFPFKGVQAWNEPHPWQCDVTHPDKLRALNLWQSGTLKVVPGWHDEWMKGTMHYLNRMVKPGLYFTFQEGRERQKLFIRKIYHYAGSDAHGSFNFTTGVGGTILTHPAFLKLYEMLGLAHGSISHTSHFGAARVYAEKPAFEEFFRGRVVCTDGPLVWPALDSDLKFDSTELVWHESWDEWAKGDDLDGQMGGDGKFDGRRTALVRRACDKMVVQYRVNEAGPKSPAIERLELYPLNASDETAPWALSRVAQVQELKPKEIWRPDRGQGVQYRLFSGLAPMEPGILMFAGFTKTDDEVDLRYDANTRRCFTNPIWLTTVKIGASANPVLRDGKALVPPGEFVATFECDHSMFEEGTTVLLKQFTSDGDSTAATYTLEATSSLEDEFWRRQKREVRGRTVDVDDCVLIARNKEPIPLGAPWYPKPGVDTFAVILVNPRDTHGNRLNAVAAKIEIAMPAGYVVPEPDTTALPDPAAGSTRTECAVLHVKPGETVQLPKGGTVDGNKIPPGGWTPGNIPAAGIPLDVTTGGHTVRVLVISSDSPPEPALEPQLSSWVGVAPTPPGGTGPASVVLKNHSRKTVEFPETVAQTSNTVIYSAPEAEPGACTVTVKSGDKETSVDLDAVRCRIAWDRPDAQVGETRELRLVLDGASQPSAWLVSGTIQFANGRVESVADPSHGTLEAQLLTLRDLPGDAPSVARVTAESAGEMIARSKLRAVRKR